MKHSCQRYLNHLSQVSDGDQSVTVSGPLPINLTTTDSVSTKPFAGNKANYCKRGWINNKRRQS